MKICKLFQRATALALAAVTALSAVPATTAFAAGDIGTISFTHTYDGAGNAIRYNSSANIGGHTAGGTGEYKYRMYVDGETAFCIQPGVPLKTGEHACKGIFQHMERPLRRPEKGGGTCPALWVSGQQRESVWE